MKNQKFWTNKLIQSKVHTSDVGKAEKWLGYLLRSYGCVVVKRSIGNLSKCVLHGCPETDESMGRSISCDLSCYF